MKIALVHDYLIQDGGAERVVAALRDVWPEAPLHVLLFDRAKMGDRFRGDVRTSYLQKLPFAMRAYKGFMPLMPAATERYDLDEFDVVLSSTSAFAKGVITRQDTLHLCYCHTPTRYLWSDTHAYLRGMGLPGPLTSAAAAMMRGIREWDRAAADRVDRFIANSETIKQRIAKYYRRESEVIHPPVETSRFAVTAAPGEYYLAGGRLVAYKRFDLAILAANALGVPLKIFGEGPEYSRLRAIAGKHVEFCGRVSESDKAALYRGAIAYLHPQEEDFGITVIEAMASGRPVIAFRRGGATETVTEGVTGAFFDAQHPDALVAAMRALRPERLDPLRIRVHALRYDVEKFKTRIRTHVEGAYAAWKNGDRREPEPAAALPPIREKAAVR